MDWSFESPVEEGVILVESESELLIIEIDDSNGTVTECCFQEDLAILLLFTDDEDDIVEVESVNITLPNIDISSKTTINIRTINTEKYFLNQKSILFFLKYLIILLTSCSVKLDKCDSTLI